jgi:predicted Zn-dependent protease
MNRRCYFITALAVAICLPAFGQPNPFKKKEDAKEKEAKAAAKNQVRYEKLKDYSTEKYKTDPDFRDEVDEAFEQIMREHSDRAYNKNISVSSVIRTVREDSWREHNGLYDNLMVQDHINRIGQKLVPPESERSFAFRVIPEPTPLAETLATGTVYVSTGLISLLDSEAQLAYVLAHEMAHVQLEHWRERVTLERGQQAYADEQAKKVGRIALIGTLLGAGLGGGIGQNASSTLYGAAAGAAAGALVGALINRPLIVAWDRSEEDAADELALKAVLAASYDVREVPPLYVAMQKVAVRDARIGLGFLGSRKRIEQRMEKAKDLIANAYKADIDVKLKAGFLSTSAEHRNLMAELKRDNGIMAYYRDMFELARTNLAEATSIRDNDPAAHYYYGKVLKLVGRTDADQKQARDEFAKAVKADIRDENYGSHLHLALMLTREKDPNAKQVTEELDAYVTRYARWNITEAALRAFPPNLETIYEYMTFYGNVNWTPKLPDAKDLQVYNTVRQSQVPLMAPITVAPAMGAPAAPTTPGVLPTNIIPDKVKQGIDTMQKVQQAIPPRKK